MPKRKQKWCVLEEDEVIHVIPNFDDEPHSSQTSGETRELSDLDCPCRPRVSFEDHKIRVIHNSFIDKKRIDKSMGN